MSSRKIGDILSSMKIRFKLFLTYIIIVIFIGLCTSLLIMKISKRIIRENSEELTKSSIAQVARFLDSKAREFEKLTFAILNDANIQKYIRDFDSLPAQEFSLIPFSVMAIINQNTAQDEYLLSYSIITPSGNVMIFDRSDKVDEFYLNFEQKPGFPEVNNVLLKMEKLGKKVLWLPSSTDFNKIFLVRKIFDINHFEYLGMLIIELSSVYFNILPTGVANENDSIILVSNTANDIILTNRPDYRQSEASYLIDPMLDSFLDQRTFNYSDDHYMAIGIITDEKEWKIVSILSFDYLLRYAKYLRIAIILIAAVTIFLAGVIAFYLSRGFTKNIQTLEKSMRKVEEGDFNIKIIPHSYDEIGLLGLRFSIMVAKINELINTVYKQRIEQQRLEFKALQAQINPHFLYNTLGSIRWLAHRNKDAAVEKMLIALVDLLRFSSDTREFCTVREEIDYIKKYLTLQKHRFEDRFKVVYRIKREALHYHMPKYILQPLVENALYHGIELSRQNGVININVNIDSSNLILEIRDNGIGMDEEKIRMILAHENEEFPGLNSIGVANTNNRIKHYFGYNYGISFKSSPGHGTSSKVVMPLTIMDARSENINR